MRIAKDRGACVRGRGLWVFALALALAPALGCGASQSPEGAIGAYARALEDGRYDAAYRLLTPELRRRYSEEAFAELFADAPLAGEVGREIRSRKNRTTTGVTLTATSGDSVRLTEARGAYYLDPASIELYPQDTPRRTVESLIWALERRRPAVLVRFASEAHRSGLNAKSLERELQQNSAEWTALSLSLRAALGAKPLDGSGDEAALVHSRGTLRLVREAGSWKVDAFE